jgi:uncharacterized protein YutE (UPF0331/DUF86 family)
MLDPVLNKKESIERCIIQIRHYYALPSKKPFAEDRLRQDAISANLQRLCQLTIDLANLTIRKKKLGLPKESADSFEILQKAELINKKMKDDLKGMVGFRNVMVHEYTKLDMELMVDVIENHLDNLKEFSQIIVLLFTKE